MPKEICNLCEHIAANVDHSAKNTFCVSWVCGRLSAGSGNLKTRKDRAHIYVLTPPNCPLKKSKTPNYYGTFLEKEA